MSWRSERSASRTRSRWPGCSARAARLGVRVGVEAERGGHQRRVRLDVGAHHDDVARLERGVVGEEADEDLPEHLDLAVRPRAGVQLDARVRGGEHVVAARGPVGGEVGLQPVQECRRAAASAPGRGGVSTTATPAAAAARRSRTCSSRLSRPR